MVAEISGGNLSSPLVLSDKNSLDKTHKFLLVNSDLKGSSNPYFLTVKLTDPVGNILFQQSEKFTKTYDGVPEVGIDENNAIRVNGELFFPVGPFGVNHANVAKWVDNGWINSLYGQGFWGLDRNISGWREYIDNGVSKGVRYY